MTALSNRINRMDYGMLAATLLMLGVGIVLVYSSSFAVAQDRFGGADYFLERQIVRVCIALVCFIACMNIDYHVWGRLSGAIFAVALVLLAIVLMLPAHHAINGAKRWLSLGPVSFQVSEFACMALILVLARSCHDCADEIKEWKRFTRLLFKIGIVCLLIVFEPNFSTASIIGIIGLSILFLSGARVLHILSIFVCSLPVAAYAVVGAPYRLARLLSFLDMEKYSKSTGYQAFQSLVGLGNGGLFGVGIGQGKQKLFYLPEPHTDFAFSILGEEIGFVGLMLVFLLFGYMIYRGMKTALNAPDRMGQLMAFGFTFVIGVYVLVHTAVNVGLVPTTGVPLPFLSYGGMSLIFTMCSVGVLMNISSQTKHMPDRAVYASKERLTKHPV